MIRRVSESIRVLTTRPSSTIMQSSKPLSSPHHFPKDRTDAEISIPDIRLPNSTRKTSDRLWLAFIGLFPAALIVVISLLSEAEIEDKHQHEAILRMNEPRLNPQLNARDGQNVIQINGAPQGQMQDMLIKLNIIADEQRIKEMQKAPQK